MLSIVPSTRITYTCRAAAAPGVAASAASRAARNKASRSTRVITSVPLEEQPVRPAKRSYVRMFCRNRCVCPNYTPWRGSWPAPNHRGAIRPEAGRDPSQSAVQEHRRDCVPRCGAAPGLPRGVPGTARPPAPTASGFSGNPFPVFQFGAERAARRLQHRPTGPAGKLCLLVAEAYGAGAMGGRVEWKGHERFARAPRGG